MSSLKKSLRESTQGSDTLNLILKDREIDCGTKNQRVESQAITVQKKTAYNPNSDTDLVVLKHRFDYVKIILN